MNNSDSRVNELKAALQKVEHRLADRETLLAAAISQTAEARSQYEQTTERLEAMRRRLEAKDEQVIELQRELDQRDERIAALEKLCAENDNALNAINQDVKLQNLATEKHRLASLGLVLESLDAPGTSHRITRETTTIGRANGNDITIYSNSVSRYHARVVVASDSTYLIDLQSTNGSRVNGQRVSRQVIRDGDVVGIGDAKFRLSTGVPLREGEDRSMDETHTLLDDSVIFTPAPSTTAREPKGKERP
jgi:uncharacterized coiled-coil protein SlyX